MTVSPAAVVTPKLVLTIVAFHPSSDEVSRLAACLQRLGPEIGYALVVNDHLQGEPVDRLAEGALLFLPQRRNLGYGRAFNTALVGFERLGSLPEWIGVLNTDLQWTDGTMEALLLWLESQPDVVLAVPQITDAEGKHQHLCKRDPSFLALFSRRFLPDRFKPSWLLRYDRHYLMAGADTNVVMDVPYLSGCCMVMRTIAVLKVGGFDSRFFLYLEDADLTRMLRTLGRCVHAPVASVRHVWGRGNHRSVRLTLVNLHSAWLYFCKWGWRLW